MKYLLFFLLLLVQSMADAQSGDSLTSVVKDTTVHGDITGFDGLVTRLPPKSPPSKTRVLIAGGVHLAAYTGTLVLLSKTWYDKDQKTSFHTFNDSKEWLQVDKVGHAWTTYQIARASADLWTWSGISRRQSVVLGGLSSIGYQTILEYLDGHSRSWGWSWSDMGANTFGAALFVSQDLAFKQQHVLLKFSSHTVRHERALSARAADLFGPSLPEKILKDYNGQTYWLSFNKSFVSRGKKLSWLNLAFGYGAKGLYGGFENRARDERGEVTFDRRDITRRRQWYLSPDIDLTKIPTRKRGVRTLLSLLNAIKIPAPALEFSGGKLKGHLLYF